MKNVKRSLRVALKITETSQRQNTNCGSQFLKIQRHVVIKRVRSDRKKISADDEFRYFSGSKEKIVGAAQIDNSLSKNMGCLV